MIKLILLCPFGYGFNTRSRSWVHKLSFFALIFMPILLNAWLMTEGKLNYAVFFVAFIGMYIVYEIGYIFNDVYTTQKESRPTKWLKREYEPIVREIYPLLVSVRITYIAIILILLNQSDIFNFQLYILFLALMNFAFSLHNYFRGAQNVWTDGALNFFKYCTVLLPFANGSTLWWHVLFITLEISLVRTTEYALGKGHVLKFSKAWDFDKLRIVYYAVLSVVAALLALCESHFRSLIVGSIYMLAYRVACILMLRSQSVIESRQSNDRGGEE